MSLITRQRLFITLVAVLLLALSATLTLKGHAGAPLAVIGAALLPLAWLAGRKPEVNVDTTKNGDNYAA